jgi:hypothetical protein
MPFVNSVRSVWGTQGRFTRGSANATGGTVITSGGYQIHTFTLGQSGTNLVVSGSGTMDYLVIGGGGGGGPLAGGGGGGGYRSGTMSVSAGTYPITVGAGGAGYFPYGGTTPASAKGGDSIFSTITANGGGGAGRYTGSYNSPGTAATGGSGGGAGAVICGGGGGAGAAGQDAQVSSAGPSGGNITYYGGLGTTGQGYPGGASRQTHGPGAVGTSGVGGNGLSSSITGTAVTRAGGGGGGGHPGPAPTHINNITNDFTQTAGGLGGAGYGWYSYQNTPGHNGVADTGGGAGSNGHSPDQYGGNGGSGIVIVRYNTVL